MTQRYLRYLMDRLRLEERLRILLRSRDFKGLEVLLDVPKTVLNRYYVLWLKERVESLRREFTVLEKRRAFLESELSRLNTSVENIRKSFEREGLTVKEALKLVGEVRELRVEVLRLRSTCEMLRVEEKELNMRVGYLRSELKKLLERGLYLINIVKELENMLSKLTIEVTELELKKQELLTEIEKLRKELKTIPEKTNQVLPKT